MTSLMSAGIKAALLRLFDASATGYVGQLLPFLLIFTLELLERLAFVLCVWPSLGAVLEAMAQARRAKRQGSGGGTGSGTDLGKAKEH
eukprot:CAMPEP_0204520430 /NCGR_PEP_ID=MMETSP0661-20131031/5260_1 /ASSEMBLY_ACC=CAM_ASM_000606 /TAXON_ID=109239 /ORGANISM="Alexandrium margalefi, Strain AMGDE01CS-322" /LENGTH=87 /DNA_ID=CAMNT_0051525985 /DNA_START=242 /DNA_END=505 /DNA_ORIENTATION=+